MLSPGSAGPEEAIPSSGARRASVRFIFILVLLDVIGFGIIIPVLPMLIASFMADDPPAAARMYGLFGTSWALMQFVFSPVLGALSDRFGRRRVLLISCTGLGLDYLLMAMAPSLTWLYIGRIISGITAANFSTAGAYLSDITPPEKRAAAFGVLGSAFGLGFVLGPALGGWLGSVNPHLPFFVSAGLALSAAFYGLFVLPESLPVSRRMPFSLRRANPVGSLKLLRAHKDLLGLAGVNALFQLAHYSLPSVYVLYTSYRYGWTPHDTGNALALVGIAQSVVQGLMVRRVVARIGERRSLMLGLACGVVGFAVCGLAPTGLLFLTSIPVMALMGFFNPGLQGLMTSRVGASEQGQLQGANASIIGLMGMLGPALFTMTLAWFIDPKHPTHLPGAPFLLAAILIAAGLLLAARVARPAALVPAAEPA